MTEHTFLSPEGTHIGDKMRNGIVLAYGEYDEETQAVLLLCQPPVLGGNYCTFIIDEHGNTDEFRYWMNLHDASNHMQEYMGQDR